MTQLSVGDLGFDPPAFPPQRLARLAQSRFGLAGAIEPLPGERDQNARITDPGGRQFVLKVSGATECAQTVDFQVSALRHIEQTDPQLPVPRLVPGPDGEFVQEYEHEGAAYLLRLLTFLPGIPYMEGPSPSRAGLRKFGQAIGRLSRALSGFSHPASNGFMPWDIGNGLVFSEQFRALVPDEVKALCEPLIDHVEGSVYPRMKQLRKQVIHQDGHGGNLLRPGQDSEEVCGIIDFGDMVYGPVLSDVAIAASHFMESGRDPLGIARSICEGFISVVPLEEEELRLLLDLVITRQILTLQLFEFRRRHMPQQPAPDVEEKPRIIRCLKRLAMLDREPFAHELCATGVSQ